MITDTLDTATTTITNSYDPDDPQPTTTGWSVVACRRPRLDDTIVFVHHNGTEVLTAVVQGSTDEDAAFGITHAIEATRRVLPETPDAIAPQAYGTPNHYARRQAAWNRIGDLWTDRRTFDHWFDRRLAGDAEPPVVL